MQLAVLPWKQLCICRCNIFKQSRLSLSPLCHHSRRGQWLQEVLITHNWLLSVKVVAHTQVVVHINKFSGIKLHPNSQPTCSQCSWHLTPWQTYIHDSTVHQQVKWWGTLKTCLISWEIIGLLGACGMQYTIRVLNYSIIGRHCCLWCHHLFWNSLFSFKADFPPGHWGRKGHDIYTSGENWESHHHLCQMPPVRVQWMIKQ